MSATSPSNRPQRVPVYLIVGAFGITAAGGGAGCAKSEPPQAGQPDAAALRPRPMPRSAEFVEQREAMVRDQIAARGVRDEAVLAAMRHVPRHWFVPDRLQGSAYADRPLSIGEEQTISQPYIVALMTEALKLSASSKVLEVGTGSGYQAAVLAEITPNVFSIEIVEPLARRAMEIFAQRGYGDIRVRIGDGYAGWSERAPFDAIIVTCAPDRVPPKLIEQLKPGGRLCIPVGPKSAVQSLRLISKQADGSTLSETLLPVRFVPMTGEAEWQADDRR